MNAGAALEQAVKQVAAKVATGKPTTAEDVHLTAVAWAIAEQKKEAAAGTTTGADLHLLQTIRGQGGAGDAAAQAICDAAVAWRQNTTISDNIGSLRWLLAHTVDQHRRPHHRRRLLRGAFTAGVVAGIGLAADGIMLLERVPEGPVRAVGPVLALVGLGAALVLLWLHGRTVRR